MIRGPSRGLGTFRCRCRWILFLPFIVSALVLSAQLDPCQAASASAERVTRTKPAGSYSSIQPPPSVSHLNQKQMPFNSAPSPPTINNRIVHSPSVNNHGGYRAAKESSSSSSSGAEEGTILRLLSKNNFYVQSFPNGTVSATGHENGYYSVLQQGAVDFGRIYIKGVASQLFLCVNKCGWLYGSKKREPECIFRDQMEGNWYNTYTSINHSTTDKSLFMAFSSNGSPCRLRLTSNTTSDGHRSIVALGSSEKYALFFPVRNISFGMNLTSLMQLNKRIPFATTNVHEPTGCAPLCTKPSNQSGKETHSGSRTGAANKDNKSKRKKKCSCLSAETPAQGGGHVQRCRRPRQCRPASTGSSADRKAVSNQRHHHHHTHHSHTSQHNSSSAPILPESSQDRHRLRHHQPAKDRSRDSRTKSTSTTETTSTDGSQQLVKPIVSEFIVAPGHQESPIDETNGKKRPTVPDLPPSVKWTVSNEGAGHTSNNNHTKKRNKSSRPSKDWQHHHHRKKSKNHQPKTTGKTVQTDVIRDSQASQDQTPLIASKNKDSRLIRHRYRKIRAHPELAQQLDVLS